MKRALPFLVALAGFLPASRTCADELRHVGDYLLKTRTKITGEKSTVIPVKPLLLSVYTDGVEIRVIADGDESACSTFSIYRSDGIGRQRTPGGALEIIPGVQASTSSGGVLRHLRLSRESLTITSFPGLSDQTVITHAIGVEPAPHAEAPAKQTAAAAPAETPAPPITPVPCPASVTR